MPRDSRTQNYDNFAAHQNFTGIKSMMENAPNDFANQVDETKSVS